MSPRKPGRTVHWRWEYRLRHRPHVMLVADEQSVTPLRLLLQSRWLCTVASDLELGLTLASLLLPSRILIDASVRHGTLLIERLKRHRDTHALPVLWLARNEAENAQGCAAGAQLGLVTPAIGYEFDVRPVQQALIDMKPSTRSEPLSHP